MTNYEKLLNSTVKICNPYQAYYVLQWHGNYGHKWDDGNHSPAMDNLDELIDLVEEHRELEIGLCDNFSATNHIGELYKRRGFNGDRLTFKEFIDLAGFLYAEKIFSIWTGRECDILKFDKYTRIGDKGFVLSEEYDKFKRMMNIKNKFGYFTEGGNYVKKKIPLHIIRFCRKYAGAKATNMDLNKIPDYDVLLDIIKYNTKSNFKDVFNVKFPVLKDIEVIGISDGEKARNSVAVKTAKGLTENLSIGKIFNLFQKELAERNVEINKELILWMSEECSKRWKIATKKDSEYELIVDRDFKKIYETRYRPKGKENFLKSCMDNKGLYGFYTFYCPEAFAVRLMNKNDEVIARTILWKGITDKKGKKYNYLDRIYYNSESDGAILLSKAIYNLGIDFFRPVGADTHDQKNIRWVNKPEERIGFDIFAYCDADFGDTLSYADTFKYLNVTERWMSNSDKKTEVNINTTNPTVPYKYVCPDCGGRIKRDFSLIYKDAYGKDVRYCTNCAAKDEFNNDMIIKKIHAKKYIAKGTSEVRYTITPLDPLRYDYKAGLDVWIERESSMSDRELADSLLGEVKPKEVAQIQDDNQNLPF